MQAARIIRDLVQQLETVLNAASIGCSNDSASVAA
jgi:hypothetical protein